jgi:hypothetical protein
MVETTSMYDAGGKKDLCALCNANCKDNTRSVNHARRTVSPPMARKSLEIKAALKVRLNLRAVCV